MPLDLLNRLPFGYDLPFRIHVDLAVTVLSRTNPSEPLQGKVVQPTLAGGLNDSSSLLQHRLRDILVQKD